MSRTIEISEDERKLLARLVHDEWNRLDKIRHGRWLVNDPILDSQLEVEGLEEKLQ